MEREALEPGTKILVVRRSGAFVGVTQERVLMAEPPCVDGGRREPRVRFGAGMHGEWVLLADEGVSWCRGWDEPEALVAANTLMKSAAE